MSFILFIVFLIIFILFLAYIRNGQQQREAADLAEQKHTAKALERYHKLLETRNIDCNTGAQIVELVDQLAVFPYKGSTEVETLTPEAVAICQDTRKRAERTVRFFMQCCIDRMSTYADLKQRYDQKLRIDDMLRLDDIGDELLWYDKFSEYQKRLQEGFCSIFNEHFGEYSVEDSEVPDYSALLRLADAYARLYALCMRLSLVTLTARAPSEGKPLLEALAAEGGWMAETYEALPHTALHEAEEFAARGDDEQMKLSYEFGIPHELTDHSVQLAMELFRRWDPDVIHSHLSDNQKKILNLTTK